MKLVKKQENEVPMLKQLLFFLPLGMTSILITITHSLFNAAIARLPSPEIYLSAFTIAKSLMQVIQNPVSMIRQTVTSLINDIESYHKVRKFVLLVVFSVVSIFAIFAFSGAAEWIFKNVMGIEGRILHESVIIFRVFIFFPAGIALRGFMQGIAIKFNKTIMVTIATVARITFVGILVLLVEKITFIPPGVIAGLMFLGAVLVESITMFSGVKLTIGNIGKKIETLNKKAEEVNTKEVTNRLILSFFGPLVITAFIRALSQPIINTGLARTISPEIAISVYAVAWGLGVIVVSPLMMFHQVPLHFIKENNRGSRESVRKFAVYNGIVLSLIMALMAFTPIGYYILRNFIGVSKEISMLSVDVLKVMTLLPLVMVTRQYYWGIMMKKHMTKYISIGKGVNLVALTITILIGTLMNISNPALVGIIGRISSEFFESMFLYYSSRMSVED